MSDLFDHPRQSEESPLADRMRPQSLDDIIGQDHIVGPGRLLRRAIAADRLSSLIFYGPPGTGKTSLARVIANTTKAYFTSLNAVLAGIKDIREAIEQAEDRRRLYNKRTILFVDEVHRWNKAQQDALLPWVENGTVILVGATTENPFFEVNRALVSRSRIFQLLSLNREELLKTALNAVHNREKGYGKWKLAFEAGALEHLVEVASGDARSLLNALELAVETTPKTWPPQDDTEINISLEAAEESIQRRAVLYDKDGDYHFDTVSAFIKSLRGSDVDAALYWLARMVRAGEDPAFIFRRMIIFAGEDVGMADPAAISIVISCAGAFDRIGFPEGNFPLSQACIYLATAPKSNSSMAFFDALKEVEKEDAEIPNHLRDASRDKTSFGHGEGYVYPHAYRDHWVAQQYLPSSLQGKTFYVPSEIGYEKKIRGDVLKRKEIQSSVLFSEDSQKYRSDEEFLSWGPARNKKEEWLKRLESGKGKLLLGDRDAIMTEASLVRYSRVLILHGGDGLLLWEALRKTPEGLVACCLDREEEQKALLSFSANVLLSEDERPLFYIPGGRSTKSDASFPEDHLPAKEEAERVFHCAVFDRILCREPWRRLPKNRETQEVFFAFAEKTKKLLSSQGAIILLQSPPALGERLSRLLSAECNAPEALTEKLALAEQAFFNPADSLLNKAGLWNEFTLVSAFKESGFKTTIKVLRQSEERLLFAKDISFWFSEKSSWGAFMSQALGDKDFQEIKTLLTERAGKGPLLWQWTSLLSQHSAA
ncbi:MAG: AAA family ATPase [Spirochaetaceae bacterium]|jgi:putative ATPase|nr:AAA family ATPase [Spirochaetaceae bacterium]